MKATFSIVHVFSGGLNRILNSNIIRLFSSVNLALSSSEDEIPFTSCWTPLATNSNFVSAERINGCTGWNYNFHNSKLLNYSGSVTDHDEMELIKLILARQGWCYKGVDLNEESVIRALNGLFDKTGNARLSLRFFRWLEFSLGLKHTVRSTCTLIHILVLGNMNHRVADLLECLVHSHLQPEELVKLLQQVCGRKVLETVYSMLVHCYSEENMIDEALQVICLIEEFGIFPSTRACNSLIKSLLDSDREELAWDLLEEMQGRSLVCIATVSLFIYYYCSKGNLECGWKLLRHMKTYGIVPDVVAYTPFIHFLCKMCYLREATCLVFKMIQVGIFPDIVLLTSVISGYCKAGQPKDAVVVLKLFGVVPDVFVYNSFISQLCEDGDMQIASVVFHEMSDSQIVPDCYAYTTMIKGYCKARNLTRALQYLGRMLKAGIEPSIATYTVLIDGYCRSGDMETAQHLLQRITMVGLKPDIIVFNTLINGYKNQGHLQKAYELLGMMKSVGISPDTVSYNTIIHGLIMAGFVSDANDMLDELMQRGFSPDVVSFTSVIDGYSRKGQFVDAFLVWTYMTNCNVRPDVVTCSALISGYCRARRMDEAHALFQKMVGAGLIPDLILYNTLIQGFCRVGNIEGASHMINMMVKNNVVPNDVTYKALILGYGKKPVSNPAECAAYKINKILHKHGLYVKQSYHL